MTTMNISLTPELAELVHAKVASGMYSNASEVIRDAIRQLDQNNAIVYQYKLDQLKQALEPGIQDVLHGRYTSFSFDDFRRELDADDDAS